MPSVTRMFPRIRLDTRWVCPATIASTSVSCRASAMSDDRAVPRNAGVFRDRVGPVGGALVDHHHLHLDALPAQLAATPRGSVGLVGRNFRPAVAPGRDEFGGVLQAGADDADLDAVDGEHGRRGAPSRGPRRCPRRRCSWPGTGSSPDPGASSGVRRRSRTRGCRRTWRPVPTRSPHRWPACPAAAPSSAGRRRRCRRRRAAAAGPGRAAGVLVEHGGQLRTLRRRSRPRPSIVY